MKNHLTRKPRNLPDESWKPARASGFSGEWRWRDASVAFLWAPDDAPVRAKMIGAGMAESLANAVGVLPQNDPGTGIAYPNLADRLEAALPLLFTFTNTDVWAATHARRRVVGVSMCVWTPKGYDQLLAPVRQDVHFDGASTVTATLDSAQSGYMLLR